MAEDDIRLVQQALEAFNGGGMEAALKLAHPDIEFQGAGVLIPRAPFRGAEAILEALQSYETNFSNLRFEALEVLARGDAVVVPAHFTGQGRSGEQLQLILTLVFWVRDGKIARILVYTSREEALAELADSTPSVPGNSGAPRSTR